MIDGGENVGLGEIGVGASDRRHISPIFVEVPDSRGGNAGSSQAPGIAEDLAVANDLADLLRSPFGEGGGFPLGGTGNRFDVDR